ncbi:MAG TPA: gluconate 2-dehydrogenase subunit 3 family protein [Tepidisphaeraceae bacterium]|nr:gluconate 2-dehydrogenase subunit 3 family protein [Tepidisphaeraceae bacterium]
MELSEEQRAAWVALVETLVPAENHPAGTTARVLAGLERRLAGDLAGEGEVLGRWLDGLHQEAISVFSSAFAELHMGIRDELLDRIEAENYRTEWGLGEAGVTPAGYLDRVVGWVMEEFERVPSA